MRVAAIIAAAGQGRRFGSAVPKQLLRVGGRTLVERSIDAFAACDRVNEIVVALPADLHETIAAAFSGAAKPIRTVAGGERRQDSVANAFDAIAASTNVIVIHDAARAFVSPALIAKTIDAAFESGAAIAAMPSRDTVKQARAGAGGHLTISATLPRDEIFLAQTPQAFTRAVLADAVALGRSGVEATDEAMLAERAGHAVRIVESDASNMKITTPEDLTLAEAIIKANGQTTKAESARVGIGYDLHRLVAGRPLILGGVTIPFDRGPEGHSDGDAVCHALTDAVLGAVAAGDIGRHFPDTDPKWKNADSTRMLSAAASAARERGFLVQNADVVVVLERPKLLPHVDAMRASVARALGIADSRVSVKGKTNEGVDAIGRGEAIAVHAVVIMRRV